MSMPRILLFTLLVTSAITQIYSRPGGGKSQKPQKVVVESGQTQKDPLNERIVSEHKNGESTDIHGNLRPINPETVIMPLVVDGDPGYIHPNFMELPDDSKPTNKYKEDAPIASVNIFASDLTSTDLLNNRDTFNKLRDFLQRNTNVLRDDSTGPNNEGAEKHSSKTDSLPPKPNDKYHEADDSTVLGPLSESISGKIYKDFIIPDIISYGDRRRGRFEHWIVPDEMRNDPKRFQEAFMKTMPERGYYRELIGTRKSSALKQIETTRMIIKKRNPQKYDFVAPERILFNVAPFSSEVPKNVKLSPERYQKWLDEILPKGRSYTEYYETGLSIEYPESEVVSSKLEENKKNGVATEARTPSEFYLLIDNMKKSLNEYEGKEKSDPKLLKQTPGYRRYGEVPDTISMLNNFDNSLVELNIPEVMKINPELYDSWFVKEMPDRGIYGEYRRAKPVEGTVFQRIDSMKTIMKIKNPHIYGFIAPEAVVVITDPPGKNVFSFKVPKVAKKDVVHYMRWLRRIVPDGSRQREVYDGDVMYFHPYRKFRTDGKKTEAESPEASSSSDHSDNMEMSHEGDEKQEEKDTSPLMENKKTAAEAPKSSSISGSSDKVEEGHEAKKVDPIISSSN